MSNSFRLSPSDLTFLWDECPRCFYLKVVRSFNRPALPFPSIFGRIDQLMKDYFESRSTVEIASELPPGKVKFNERWVTSATIELPGHSASVFLRGKFDTVVEFSDGAYGVVDFKTSQPKQSHIAFYGRQLHAYSYALENPAPGKFGLSPITRLGLMVVEPVAMDRSPDGRLAYLGEVTWTEIPKDDGSFLAFLDQVLTLLEQPEPPESHPKCGWCSYRLAARTIQL